MIITNKNISVLMNSEDWIPIRSIVNRNPVVYHTTLVMIILIIVYFGVTRLLGYYEPYYRDLFNEPSPFMFGVKLILYVLLLDVVTTVLHELCHILPLPGGIFSDHTYVIWRGFTKMSIVGVSYTAELSKVRYIVVGLSPFFFLTICPLTIMALLNTWSPHLLFICLYNFTSSFQDITTSLEIAVQAPRHSKLLRGHYRRPMI